MVRRGRCLAACVLFLEPFRADASWVVDSGFHHTGTGASIFSIDHSPATGKSRSRLHRRAPLLRRCTASRDDVQGRKIGGVLLCWERGDGKRTGRDCRRWRAASFVACPFVFLPSEARSCCCSTGIPVSPRGAERPYRYQRDPTPSRQWSDPGRACPPLFVTRQAGGRRRCHGVVSMMKEDETTTADRRSGSDDIPLRSSDSDQGSSSSSSSSVSDEQEGGVVYEYVRPEIPTWKHKAVIIPGFATDARAFEQLCHRLERRGIASVVVPIRWYHWLPTLGGRSVRPILDRIHETVIRCVAARGHKEMPYAFNEPGLQNEVAPYTWQDFWAEMGDPKRGAHHMGPLGLPAVPAMPPVDDRVILIAHSAGGWISRIYLSEARYDGRVYNASSLVSGLVTLGTPHVRLEDEQGRPRELPFSRNFKFVEEFCTGEKGGSWEEATPTTCIGGAVLRGHSTFGGLLKDLVYQSYELCCGDGTGVGDGITPLQSAFDMAGAERYVELEGVYHAAGLGGPWYGSDNVIDSWLEPSLDTIFGPPTADTDRPTIATPPWKPSNPAVSGAGCEGDGGRAGAV